jgi:hypothetical protein
MIPMAAIADAETASVRAFRARVPVWRRALLLTGLLWALIVVVPDVYRIYGSLAELGFSADNSGNVYEADEAAPNGLKVGDQIMLRPGACWTPSSDRCRDFLAVFGGMGGLSYVRPGTVIKLRVSRGGRPLEATIAAQSHPLDFATRLVLALDEIAGVAMIWLAFQLVWDRPNRMTLGFFLYAMWFNPGQYFAFYAWLQQYPVLFLLQESLQAIAQGAGYAGFLIFALRFPYNRTEANLRFLEWLAAGLGAVLAVLQLASFANVFGLQTEAVTRYAIFGGYAVSLSTILVVLYRLKRLPPLEHQRMRWVLWGCLIGIPAFIFADSNEATSFWTQNIWPLAIWHGWTPSEAILELGYLLCGILAIFIWMAVRHPRVLSVTPELIALGVSGIFFVIGYKLEDIVRDPVTAYLSSIGVPLWMQFLGGIAPLGGIGAFTHRAMRTTDNLFNFRFHHASAELDQIGAEAKQTDEPGEIDKKLVHGPCSAMNLSAAAVFRQTDGQFTLVHKSEHWPDRRSALEPKVSRQLLDNLAQGKTQPIPIPIEGDEDNPADVTAPAVMVPVVFDDELQAAAMYSVHATGADIDHLEKGMLQDFAARIALAYERLRKKQMQKELSELRQQLAAHRTAAAANPTGP